MLSCCKFLHGAEEILEVCTGMAAAEVCFELSNKAGILGSFKPETVPSPKMGHRSKIITRSATEPPNRFGGWTPAIFGFAASTEFRFAGLDLSEMCCFC